MKFLKEKKKRGASDSPLYAHSLLSYLHRVEREGKRSSARVLLPLFFLSALKSKKIKKNCDIKKQTNTQQRVKAAPSFIILHFPFFFECEVALGEPLARCWPTHFPVCSIFFVKRGKEREKEKQFVVSREGGEHFGFQLPPPADHRYLRKLGARARQDLPTACRSFCQ